MSSENEITLARHMHDNHQNLGVFEEEEVTDEDKLEASKNDNKKWREYSSPCLCGNHGRGRGWLMGRVLDPQATWVQEWNRVFLSVWTIGLFVDPLFFYSLSLSKSYMCLYVDGWLAITVTVLRCMIDALHVWNMWLQLKMAKHPHDGTEDKGGGASVGAFQYFKAKDGFFFDLFVILPVPQVVIWVVVPCLLRRGETMSVMRVWLILFLFQYLPKIWHSVCLRRRKQRLSSFGSFWWSFALNIVAYFVASQVAGACWFLLGIQRTTKCLLEQCNQTRGCNPKFLASLEPIYYGTRSMVTREARHFWAHSQSARFKCLDSYNNYEYGNYKWIIYLVSNNSRFEKILMPIFWGIMMLSTFGNLESTTDSIETVFITIVMASGLFLMTMLMGNVKDHFWDATISNKHGMRSRMRKLEWWMSKRKLPTELKQRVRSYEWQQWAAMRGVDEFEMIQKLPEGLRRDIKYHICLDLVRQVPLFQHMDDLVLENICDRLKSLILTKGETITKEGDPVQKMLFIVRGHLLSGQVLHDGVKSCCMLGPGNFSGDELLSWCLRQPFVERLPPSLSTVVTLETTEAFELEAEDVKYVTHHFRYIFANEKVKRIGRYYSPGWRTWAAVTIQLAWRRCKHRLTLTSVSFVWPKSPSLRSNSLAEDKLWLYTTLLTSPKPNEDYIDI